MQSGKDSAVFLWKLTQLLQKRNPLLPAYGQTALLERQFMHGLPAKTHLKLLEQDVTLALGAMVSFAKPFLSDQEQTVCGEQH